MKAAAVTAPGVLEIVDIPVPRIKEYECLVRTRACGLCNSTDLKMIACEVGDGPGFILGHEGVGEVVEVGGKVENYRMGDTVTDPTLREEEGARFRPMCGQFAEYTIVQDLEVMKKLGIGDRAYRAHCSRRVPRAIGFEDATILLTFKETLSALRNFGFQSGMDVLIYGDGPIGLSLINLMRLGGANWLGAVGHWDVRLEKISATGRADQVINERREDVNSTLRKRHFDLIIDAVGSSAIIKRSFGMLKSRGRICVFGVLPKNDPGVSIRDFRNNTALHLLQWPVGEHEVHEEVVDMVETGKLDPKDYYSHVEPLENIHEAVRKVKGREAFKVVISLAGKRYVNQNAE